MNDTVEVVKNLPREPGLHIWRIENMELAAIPEKTYGSFYEGDCYILLNLRRSGSSSSCDLHYWIGEHSSQDEQGTAAFLTAQLDTQLGGFAIQHREFQEHESSTFRSYFKNRLMYKKGGVASGFRHVETNTHNVQRLLHIKGRKNCTAREVSMDWSSFNNGDCFLLDLGKMIIQYNGAESHYKERMKAVRMASDIRDRERGGRAQVGIVDGDQESSSPELMGVLHSVLGQRKGNLPPATPDTTPDRETMANLKLYLVSDTEGKLMVEEMATRPLTQDLLNSKDCYILDQCGVKISVWKGKHSSQEEKQAAMKQALGFIKAKGYPQTTNVETMVDGAESAMFKHLFTDWKDRDQTEGFGRTYSINRVAKVEQVKFDVTTLHAQPQLAAEQRMVDDGSGTLEVFRVEHLELAPVPKKLFGQFYGGDCYLVLYTYTLNHRQAYIIYMWQGLKASHDEVTASAYQCVELDNKVNGQAVQVRVIMGKEPKHFLAIFKGKLVIYQGGTSRVGGNSEEPLVRLFQVRGTNETNTKAIEVPARSTSLNSNDVFVLKRKMDTHCFLWCGKGCSGDEREMARTVADLISHQEKSMELEGNESSEFWAALGGKAPYSNDKRLQEKNVDQEPRLFECSTQTGRFYVTEICNFTQEDLDEEDVMLLDTWDQVWPFE
uniref:Villin 1 n=1 Tax=Eptatretus burgeri TaxID=7764 RepID=A0A8C4NAG8_EPTBU